ncbi:hypothetical protein TTHERM_00213570 (macronuclear) [Tetrahymena thermophila SB210]|uniref:Uncharacterized protein n=1 Tax=Tetrahymena thermophila (strain SB210) TaxID=312017 RepID=Q22N78_TETTS|nr:hypothetical protein TTHERM_00213570 [Tetrahymena thermophila SB210]EAR86907.2 hypothetical protein TTHERM_00213570 [Tetrahymena thermophila SB210]|eukprot:XP_001007152.2 hypothetical protein TTHERM_00213570 [Tetrahymena thermophila SB210]
MSAKFQSNEVQNDSVENIEIVQYLEAQNVQKYFDYKIEKPKNNSFQTIELLKKKQNSLNERLTKMFSQQQQEDQNLKTQGNQNDISISSQIINEDQNKDFTQKDQLSKLDISPNCYHIEYIKSNQNNSDQRFSPLKPSSKINVMNTQKSQTTSKKETIQTTNYNYQQQSDQYKENNTNVGQQSERLSTKINYTTYKDQKAKNIFNSRYGNQHQILTIILEVPTGVDKLVIENEDEVSEKAKNFCIKHNYSLDCVPQLIVQINQQIERLLQENSSQQETQLNNKRDSQYIQNSSYKMDQLPSFQDSIFERSTQNQVNKQPRDFNQNIYNQRYELNSCKKNLFLQENQQMKKVEKQANEIRNIQQDLKEEQKKPFYNIYDSHEEALSELYNRKQQEMKSLFKIEKSNKNNLQELGSNQSFNLSESQVNNQSQSSKKTTKKWKRDISPNQVQNFQQHTDKQNENQVEYRSTSPLLDKNCAYPCKNENIEEGSPIKAHGNLLKKENSQQNLMKNLRDQVKLQKAESSANLNKQQESKIQDLIDTNNLQNMRKNELQNTQKETNQKSDLINSPIIKQMNSQIYDSNMKFHKSNSLAHQISQNSSYNDQFYHNQNSNSKGASAAAVHVINSQGIKKSNSALFINKGHIQPIEEILPKQVKPTEETKKKRSISPFSNSNLQQISNKNYYKNTVSQQNKINDKSKELQSRSRSPIQTTKQNRSISNTRKKSAENNNANISKPKVIACNSSNLISQSKEKPANEDEKQKNKEAKSVTPGKSMTKTLSQNKISRSKTPTKDQNQKIIIQNKQHAAGTNLHNEENENNFQPQISEQSKKIAEASRQKGIGIHERLYNQAKKELKKKEQWDMQLKKILNKNQTPNSKKEGASNQLAYFQLKSIHNNSKAAVASKTKEYVIYQNNISPFKPKEPELIKGKKRDISSEREESKPSQLKYNKCGSQGLLFHTKEQIKDKSIRNDSTLLDDKQKQKLLNFESKGNVEECQTDDQKIIQQQQELLNYYQNMSDKYLKSNKTENQTLNNVCQTLETQIQSQSDLENPVKSIQEGLIFQKKTQTEHEKEHAKVQQRYHTYDNEDELEKMSQLSRDSQRRDSQLSQAQNRLETQLFQNQLKQLQLQEEMKNQFKSQNQSIESIYPNQDQNNIINPIQLNSNQSFTQLKKQEQGDEKLKKVLEYIFFALDSDSDGQISTENIDLSKLNTTILMIIQDVLIDVENLGGFVDLDCFCSLVKRRKVEQQLLDYVFSDNSLSYSPNNEEKQLSGNTSKYFTKQSNNNNNNNNINSADIQQKQEYFNEYEKQAVEFLSKNSHENDTVLSGALLTNESITPDIFFEKKKEYFDVQEYEKKLLELQQKSNFYDLNFENREDQHQISSRYKNLIENEQKYQKNSQSPAFGNDSIYKIKN